MRKRTTSLLFLLILSIYTSNINVQSAIEENDYRPTSLDLTPHDPIWITSFLGFEVLGCHGNGLADSPYIIEGYNITTTENYGIYITSTNVYFIVRNCYVDAEGAGIYINLIGIAEGTVTINNNTCNNNLYGIFLMDSGGSTVVNNTCSNNNQGGILFLDSGSSTVANNTCNNNGKFGIRLSGSDTTVINNTCSNNGEYGIDISGSDTTVINNTCNNNGEYGIEISGSNASVFNNTCNNNGCGIKLDYSNYCNITYNLIQENEGYGVYSFPSSDDNTIHHNTFVDNNLGGTSQACDNCTNDYWYDSATLEGNYWSDWSGIGSYSIDGSAGAIDLYPLLDKPVIEFDSPTITDIVHSPSSPTELDAVTISATVADSSGVQSVTLHFRINSGTWQVIDMTIVSSDLYRVTIGSFAVSDNIEYYISAVDNSINHNSAVDDNDGLYYSFTVSVVIPEFQMFLLPTITFLFLVVVLVVIQRRKKQISPSFSS